jgi:glycosyltransferase involved in cell wall biosynthesis
MASGLPVIASAAGGNGELVRHEINGLLVAPLDATSWAAAIERLLQDATLAARLGRAGRDTARVTFSLERTVEQTLQLYRSLVPEAPLAPAAPHR